MRIPMVWVVAWFIATGLAAVVVTVSDKNRARGGKRRRIPERTLWYVSALGGSLVMFLTMRVIRHKTLHRRFMIGIPLLILVQVALVFLLWHNGLVIFI